MPSNKRALLVVNANSRQGGSDIAEACARLRESGIELLESSPDSAEAMAQLIEELADKVDCVILGGGDGTLHCATDALRKTGLPFGVLPLGTANDFAKTIGIPPDPLAAADVIVAGHVRAIDLGYANDVSFLNAADIGLGTEVTQRLDSTSKGLLGALAYPATVFRAWQNNRSFTAQLECDGETEDVRVIQIKVANGKFYGGGMSIVDDATIDNNQLVMVAIKPADFLELIKLAPLLRVGWVREHNRLVVREARNIKVKTKKRMPVSTDGELTTETPVTFKVKHRALQVFAPGAETSEDDGS